MLNLNKHTQKKRNLNLNQRANLRTVHTVLFAYHCAQLLYTTQHRTILIIFPPNLQTVIDRRCCLSEGRGIEAPLRTPWRDNRWIGCHGNGISSPLKMGIGFLPEKILIFPRSGLSTLIFRCLIFTTANWAV